MQSLHESVLTRERLLLEEEDPNYPVFTVQVPEDDVDYVTLAPAEVFFIAFEDIFNLFHTRRLDYNLVRLYTLTWL